MDAVRDLLNTISRRRVPRDEETGLPKKYVAGLTPSEKSKQVKAIEESMKQYRKTGKVMERPALGESKRSPLVIEFEKRYGFPITDLAKVKKTFPGVQVEEILAKGRAAFASGSRPGQTPSSWAFARLASVLLGKKALGIDEALVSDAALKKILESK
jgi:hypothetical protein